MYDGFIAYKKPAARIHPDESINPKINEAGSSDSSAAESNEATLTMNVGVCLTACVKYNYDLIAVVNHLGGMTRGQK